MFLPASFTPLWSALAPSPPGGLWFVLEGGRLLTSAAAGQADALTVPKGDGPPIPVDGARCIGLLGEVPCWAARARVEAVPHGFTLEPLRRLFDRMPDELVAVAGRAAQALEFDRTHRHCGACAAPTEESDGGRARRCLACGEVYYPRLAPAMMVLVTRQGPGGRELLLASGARSAARSGAPIYSALAGFVEPSESLEDCVRREVDEEVGLRVRGLRYFGSQCWPFPHSLMVAFLAEYAGGEIHCQEGEIVDAQWFPVARLPALPHRLSVARRLIDHAVAEAER
jgi:NAD+ diphosphatase